MVEILNTSPLPSRMTYEVKADNSFIQYSERRDKISELIEKSSNAKTFDGWLKARIQIANKNRDIETEKILSMCLNKFKEYDLELKGLCVNNP